MKYKVVLLGNDSTTILAVRSLLEKEREVQIVGEASAHEDALEKILTHKPDIIYSDILGSDGAGLEMMKKVATFYQPAVVIATKHPNYAVQAFELAAADYLLNPFTEVRFRESLERAKNRLARKKSSVGIQEKVAPKYLKRILIRDKQTQRFVNLDDVIYIEAEGNYMVLHTTLKKFMICEKLFQLENRLDPTDFVRINRSYLVNLAHCKELANHLNSDYVVVMSNGDHLKWTRFYKENLKLFFAKEYQ